MEVCAIPFAKQTNQFGRMLRPRFDSYPLKPFSFLTFHRAMTSLGMESNVRKVMKMTEPDCDQCGRQCCKISTSAPGSKQLPSIERPFEMSRQTGGNLVSVFFCKPDSVSCLVHSEAIHERSFAERKANLIASALNDWKCISTASAPVSYHSGAWDA